jgi:hypothetical protein
MWIKIVNHQRLHVILTVVVSPEETAVKKSLLSEQLHHEDCSTAYRSVKSYRVAGWPPT